PRYNVDPIPYLCQNAPATFLNGPFDSDNDLMITTSIQPRSAAANVLIYQAPNTALNPINSSTGYNIDQNTATAYFTPTTLGKYVLAFRTADYDPITNIEYSYINRDVQVSIIPCEATSKPLIDSIPQNLSIGSKYI